MNELWKGIAIAGIWIACALSVYFIMQGFKGMDSGKVNFALLFVLAFLATWVIAAN